MRIITINVNGIRAAERKGFFSWLEKQNADVVCLQEIKAQEDQLDERFYPSGMHTYYHSAERKGYSGTGLYCKSKPDRITYSPWGDINFEGRLIQADFGDLRVSFLSTYPQDRQRKKGKPSKWNLLLNVFCHTYVNYKKMAESTLYVVIGISLIKRLI